MSDSVDTSPLGIERTERIAGDAALESRLDTVHAELTTTQKELGTEVLHRSEGDLVIQRILSNYIQDLLSGKEEEFERYLQFQNEQNLNYADVKSFVTSIRYAIADEVRALGEALESNLKANDTRFNKLSGDVQKYLTILSDITLDSNQITLDNGELRAGAWTILSQARQWDLEIIQRLNGLNGSITDEINDRFAELDNTIPSTEELISKAIEELSNSPEIVELSNKLNESIEADIAHARELEAQALQHALEMQELAATLKQEAEARAAAAQALIDGEIATRISDINKEVNARKEALQALVEDIETSISLTKEELNNAVDAVAESVSQSKEEVRQTTEELLSEISTTRTDIKKTTDELATSISQAKDGLTTEIKQRKDADASNLNVINTYKVSNDAAITGLQTNISNNVTKTNANTTAITGLTARIQTAEDDLGNVTQAAADAMSKATTAVNANSALASRVDALAASITESEGTVVDVNAFNALKAEVNTVKGVVTGLVEDVTALENNYSSVNGKVTSQGTAISKLNTQMTAAEGSISQSANDITLLKADMTTVTNGLANKVSSDAFSQLTSQVSTLESGYQTQSEQITSLNGSLEATNTNVGNAASAAQNAMNLAGAKGKVFFQATAPATAERLPQNLWIDTTGNTNTPKRWNGSAWVAVTDKVATDALDAANAATSLANTKADAAAFTKLDQKVTVIDGKVTSSANQVLDLQSRMTTTEGDLAKKADATVLNNYYTKSQTDGKATEIAAGQINEYASTLMVGGDNLAAGYDIGIPFSGSRFSGSSTVISPAGISTDEMGSISTPYRVTSSGGSSTLKSTPSLTAYCSAPVVISFKLKNVGDVSARVNFNGLSSQRLIKGGSLTVPPRSEIIEFVVTGVMRPDYAWCQFQLYAESVSSIVDIVLADVQLEIGNTPTGWKVPVATLTNALEANASAIQTTNAEVTRVDGVVTSQGKSITSLENSINQTNNELIKKASASAVDSLTNRVTATEGGLTSVSNRTTSLENAVNHSTNGLSTKASTVALNTLDSKVTTVDGKVTTATNSITALKGRVDTVENGLATKADVTALNNIYTKTESDAKAQQIAAGEISSFSAALRVGEDNLLKDSNVLIHKPLGQTAYLVGRYESWEEFGTRTFTLTACVSVKGGTPNVRLVPYQGSGMMLEFTEYEEVRNSDKAIVHVTFTAKDYGAGSYNNNGINFYIYPNSPAVSANIEASIHWATLVEGNAIPASAWRESSYVTKNKLDANANAIQNTNTEVSKVDGKVKANSDAITTLNSSVGTINNSLATKLDSSVINNYYTKTQTDAKALSTAAGEVSKYDASLVIGGSNLLLNSNFEGPASTDNWSSNGGGYTKVTDSVYGSVVQTTLPNGLNHAWLTLENGVEYTYSMLIKPTTAIEQTVISPLHYHAGLNKVHQNKLQVLATSHGVIPANVWTRVWLRFKLSGDANSFRPFFYGGPTNTVQIAWSQLERGNKATDWSPSAADTQGKLDANAAAITSTNAEVSKVDGRVTTTANDITSLKGRMTTAENGLALKADSSALNNVYTKTQADAKALEITSGEVGKYNANLRIGSKNLISKTKWQTPAIAAVNKSDGYEFKLVDTAAPYTGAWGMFGTWTDLEMGGKYVFSFKIKALDNTPLTIGGHTSGITNTGADAVYLDGVLVPNTTFSGGSAISIPNDGKYHLVVVLLTKNSSATDYFYIQPNRLTSYTQPYNCSVKEVMLSEGTAYSQWVAPDDYLQDQLDANATAITNTNAEVTRVDGRVTATNSNVTALTGRVNKVEGDLTSKADVSAVSALSTRVGDVEGGLRSQAANTTALEANLSYIGDVASLIANSKLLYGDTTFDKGTNNVGTYDNASSGLNKVERVARWTVDNPTKSSGQLNVTVSAKGTPGYGGFVQTIYGRPNAVFVIRYLLKLPMGYRLVTASNAMGTGSSDRFIGSTEGTGKYETYIRIIKCGATGTFSSSGHVYVYGSALTGTQTLTFPIAKIEAYDATDYSVAHPDVLSGLEANASAISTTSAEVSRINGVVVSQGDQLSLLKNSVAGKADTSALNSLSSKVTDSEDKLASQANSITALRGSLDDVNDKATKALDSVTIDDTRSTNQPPSWYLSKYARRRVNEFKQQSAIGASGFFGGTYCNLETLVPYSDLSGGHVMQTATSAVDPSMYIQRQSTSTSAWSAWTQPIKDIKDDVAGKASASAVNTMDIEVKRINGVVVSQANTLTVLTSDNDKNKNALTIQGKVIDGVKANYMVKMETNGILSGFGLIQETGALGAVKSTFGVHADSFFIGAPASGKKPFIVTTSTSTVNGVSYPAGTWIDTALIANATIGGAKIANASITNAQIANLDAAKITSGTIAAGRITADSLSAGVIGTTHLAAGAVTADKISTAAIDTISLKARNGTFTSSDGSKTVINGGLTQIYYANGKLAVKMGVS